MSNKSFVDIMKRLNPRFKSDPEWRSIFHTVSGVIDQQVGQSLEDMKTSADPKRWHRGDGFVVDTGDRLVQATINKIEQREDGYSDLHIQLPNRSKVHVVTVSNRKDRTTLINGAVMDGLNYFSDALTDADYERINLWVNQFWPHTSADNFVRFMGFIKNLDLNVFQLWSYEPDKPVADPEDPSKTTLDYYPVLDRKDGSMRGVHEGGTWYPTSHVELEYDALVSKPPGNDLNFLFYLLAPIHLVLERISASILLEQTFAVAGAADLQFHNGAALINMDALDPSKTFVYYFSHLVEQDGAAIYFEEP